MNVSNSKVTVVKKHAMKIEDKKRKQFQSLSFILFVGWVTEATMAFLLSPKCPT